MAKIALIEASPSHDECLYAQIKFLKSDNHQVILICNHKLKERVEGFDGVDQFMFLELTSKLKKYYTWFTLWRYLRTAKIDKVVFNTAESHIYKLLLFPFPKRIELIGTIHNAFKLKSNRKQKKIDQKLDKYFTLSEYITRQMKSEKLTQKPVGTFFPMLFPSFENSITKPKNEIWITIPGGIALDKRDYNSLLQLEIPSNYKIILLGKPYTKENIDFIEQLKNSAFKSQLICFKDYIPLSLFHSYIANSDYILPLIHPNGQSFDKFLKYKITGSNNLAYGYKIPMLMEQAFANFDDFKDCATFYDFKDLNSIFELIQKDEKKYYQEKIWEFEYQKKKYLDFLFSK